MRKFQKHRDTNLPGRLGWNFFGGLFRHIPSPKKFFLLLGQLWWKSAHPIGKFDKIIHCASSYWFLDCCWSCISFWCHFQMEWKLWRNVWQGIEMWKFQNFQILACLLQEIRWKLLWSYKPRKYQMFSSINKTEYIQSTTARYSFWLFYW